MSTSAWSSLSDDLFAATLVLYSLAMFAFAAAFAFDRQRGASRVLARSDERAAARSADRVLVGAGGPPVDAPAVGAIPDGPPAEATDRHPGAPARAVPVPAPGSGGNGRRAGIVALVITGLGWLTHLGAIVARGLAAQRAPWGNMYEFSMVVAFVAVSVFLVLAARSGRRDLGVFVLVPAVLYLGLAGSVLYVPVGPLVPALHSYWLVIHVAAAMLATGSFLVGGVATGLYLVRDRYDRLVAAGRTPRWSRIGARLPATDVLDRVQLRIVSFAFPIWTFAIVAGAIWAEAAWGRYWGWDPKETASFVTWVAYAAYLHARATAGWRGRKAAYLALFAVTCLMFDYYAINTFVVGLHSYAK